MFGRGRKTKFFIFSTIVEQLALSREKTKRHDSWQKKPYKAKT